MEGTIEEQLGRLESLLGSILRHGNFDLEFRVIRQSNLEAAHESVEGSGYVVEFSGADRDLLLEKNGELLNALEQVVLRSLRFDDERVGRISFDCDDWRRVRVEELKLMAYVAAERVLETNAPFRLQPMTPWERRVVHLALRDQPAVTTALNPDSSFLEP